jgi:hypothetical protein
MLVRACVYRNDPEAVNRGPPLHYLLLQRRGQPQSHGTMEGEAAAYGSVPAVRRRRRWCSRNSGARTAARQHPPVPAGAQRERGCDLLVSIQKFHHTHSPSLIHHPTIICTTLLSHSNDYLKCSLLFFAAVSASPYNSAALSSLPPFNSARLSALPHPCHHHRLTCRPRSSSLTFDPAFRHYKRARACEPAAVHHNSLPHSTALELEVRV